MASRLQGIGRHQPRPSEAQRLWRWLACEVAHKAGLRGQRFAGLPAPSAIIHGSSSIECILQSPQAKDSRSIWGQLACEVALQQLHVDFQMKADAL